jgi:hypothetical protein
MRMSARARAGRLALQLCGLLVVCGWLIVQSRLRADARIIFDRGITVKASSTPTQRHSVPTPANSGASATAATARTGGGAGVRLRAAPPPPPTAANPSTSIPADWAQSILASVSQTQGTGLGARLRWCAQSSAGTTWNCTLGVADVFALNHNLDGGPGDRAWARGYCCAVAEILATAEGSAQQVFDLWMSSPSHGGVILDGAYDHVGVSCYQAPYESATRGLIYPVICAAEFGNSNP